MEEKYRQIWVRPPVKRFFFFLQLRGRQSLFRTKKTLVDSLTFLYEKCKLYEIAYFFRFLFHNYDPRQFDITHIPANLRLLYRLSPGDWVASNRHGQLTLLSTPQQRFLFSLKNTLLFGALQKRIEKVVLYSYLTLTLELNNPFERKTLLFFLEKKIALLERLLNYVKRINGKLWDPSDIRLHIEVFKRNSLLQAEVIRRMRLAVRKEGQKPLIEEAKQAMAKGLQPVLITQGMSGAYWIRGTDRRILGLFKPFDEEIHAPNNPVGLRYQGALGLRKTRRGCMVGESAHHEVAAFVVDEFFGFGIVPRTYYAELKSRVFFLSREDRLKSLGEKKKMGSFQEFVEGFVPLNKLSKEAMLSIPVDEFQLLVLLDVIIGNTDRNIGNILMGDETIAAIDHGLCFPDTNDTFSFWYWSYFSQGELAWLPAIVDLLNQFPYDALEIKLRKKCFIKERACQRLRERVALFTEAVNLGLVPARLENLFTSDYLTPLKDRKITLQSQAKEQAALYKKNLGK